MLGARYPTIALPPAFSIFAFADSENFAAVMLMARVISPSPSTSRLFRPSG
jgi:hypothetical protein